MKKVTVKVCVCSNCVMAGSIDIISSIESLKKIKGKTDGVSIKIEPFSCPQEENHAATAPVVIIDGERLENAITQTVMAKILENEA